MRYLKYYGKKDPVNIPELANNCMKHYLHVYRKLVSMNISSLLAYRSAFISNLISSTAWALFIFISIFLLTNKTPVLFGWRREEIILLSAIYSIYYGIFQCIFAKNFGEMAILIDNGEIESFFLKPIDAQFFTSLSKLGITAFIRVPIGIGFMYFFGKQLGISMSFFDGALFIIALCFSLAFLYALWMNVLLCLIWNPRLSNLVEVLFTVSGMSRYPGDMYRMTSEVLMYVLIPLTFTTVVPARILFHTAVWQEYVILIGATMVLYIVARKFWLFAIKHYTSASN